MSGISDYSYLFSSLSSNSSSSTINLADYAAIKNGSYGKLLKAYYAKQEEEEAAESGDSEQTLSGVKSSADALKESADALNDDSLWEKKTVTTKDETTGVETETEDYDWDAITKAVEAFVEDYNNAIEQAGNSDTKGVLCNAAWMTSMVATNENLLSKVGITIGTDNKLSVDTEALKEADISTLKVLFSGNNSLADQISQKANSIGNAATRVSSTYTSSGTYSDTLSELVSSTVDEEV